MAVLAGGIFYWNAILNKKQQNNNKLISKRIPASIANNKKQKIENKSQKKYSTFSKDKIVIKTKIEITKLEKCFKTYSCDFPNNDSKEYDLLIGQEIKNKILTLQNDVEKYSLIDPEISIIARNHLLSNDGHIKEASMRLLISQPTSEKNLNSILNNAINHHDSMIAEMAMNELSRYHNSKFSRIIDDYLQENLITGGHYTGQIIAKLLTPFLNEENINKYKGILIKLSPYSLKSKYLKSSIEDYSRSK